MFIDTKHLNAISYLSHYNFPFLPTQVLITQINGKTISTSNLFSDYHQVALTHETLNLVPFVVAKEQFKYKREIFGLRALPRFFTRIMTIIFAKVSEKKETIS